MPRERIVDHDAKRIVSHYKKTKNIGQLARDISALASWHGRFGSTNRILFTEAIVKELKQK